MLTLNTSKDASSRCRLDEILDVVIEFFTSSWGIGKRTMKKELILGDIEDITKAAFRKKPLDLIVIQVR